MKIKHTFSLVVDAYTFDISRIISSEQRIFASELDEHFDFPNQLVLKINESDNLAFVLELDTTGTAIASGRNNEDIQFARYINRNSSRELVVLDDVNGLG